MAKTFKIIILACFIGSSLAACFFFSLKSTPEAKEKNIVNVIQAGVFKVKENAYNSLSKYENAKIIIDQDYYRLIIGVTVNNKELLKEYYANYDIYLKEIAVSDEEYQSILKWDELLKKSPKDNYNEIIKKGLEVLNELQN